MHSMPKNTVWIRAVLGAQVLVHAPVQAVGIGGKQQALLTGADQVGAFGKRQVVMLAKKRHRDDLAAGKRNRIQRIDFDHMAKTQLAGQQFHRNVPVENARAFRHHQTTDFVPKPQQCFKYVVIVMDMGDQHIIDMRRQVLEAVTVDAAQLSTSASTAAESARRYRVLSFMMLFSSYVLVPKLQLSSLYTSVCDRSSFRQSLAWR